MAKIANVYYGSSPRLRGTRNVDQAFRPSSRFIPAPAGNTRWTRRITVRSSVHPRACGEHVCRRTRVRRPNGSSPRLRGTRTTHPVLSTAHGFIPAPAGNTTSRRTPRHGFSVHPRACGEHRDLRDRRKPLAGSSPRLRGTPERDSQEILLTRFIPAPAGNTAYEQILFPNESVHPRACGEHNDTSTAWLILLGSSPRLRGTRVLAIRGPCFMGFIPAPAGNTLRQTLKHLNSSVHPRACGEHAGRNT